ncbi:MAG TPA: Holliday junction branch migration protein RuvA [Polyangiaceae bacterium]|nr:Holliday junction branch migration protein RuvA [Polyangiaceae bacterium]
MIGRLTGRVVHEEPTGAMLLDVHGVGYELTCPVGTLGRAASDGGESTLYVHTNLRQDALELFGFASLDERQAFRQLIQVPNVGPRTALAVLSALPVAELARVIEAENTARLAKVPGIGKKTSERLVLELRGKLLAEHAVPHAQTASGAPGEASGKLVMALVGLGYKPAEAERAARAVAEEPLTDLSSQLRRALAVLAS